MIEDNREKLEEYIILNEGWTPFVYTDARGNSIIGVGFNLNLPDAPEKLASIGANYEAVRNHTDGLTSEQILQLLHITREDGIALARRIFPVFDNLKEKDDKEDNRQVVLADLAMMGEDDLQRFQKAIDAVNRKDWDTAANEITNTEYYRTGSPRLRRFAEAMINPDILKMFSQEAEEYMEIVKGEDNYRMSAIDVKYMALGGAGGILGQRVGSETPTPDGIGRVQQFQGGVIYWHPDLGAAYAVHGAICAAWDQLGGTSSVLGYPRADEASTPDGVGRFQVFQSGDIYWEPNLGTHALFGDIRAKWEQLGGLSSAFGYPLTDETPTPDGIGRVQQFQGGVIYWHPDLGAYTDKDEKEGKG